MPNLESEFWILSKKKFKKFKNIPPTCSEVSLYWPLSVSFSTENTDGPKIWKNVTNSREHIIFLTFLFLDKTDFGNRRKAEAHRLREANSHHKCMRIVHMNEVVHVEYKLDYEERSIKTTRAKKKDHNNDLCKLNNNSHLGYVIDGRSIHLRVLRHLSQMSDKAT